METMFRAVEITQKKSKSEKEKTTFVIIRENIGRNCDMK